MSATVLMINPPIYDFAAYDLFSKPLGLLHIAHVLRQNGYRVKLVDALDRHHPMLVKAFGPPKGKPNGTGKYHAEIIPTPACLRHIPRNYRRYGLPEDIMAQSIMDACREEKPIAVLVSSMMTYWYPAVSDTIKLIRRLLPATPIALGGVYATLFPDHALGVCQPDKIFVGADIKELINWLKAIGILKKSVSSLTMDYQNCELAYDLYGKLDYATLLTSKGCPFKCDYCGGRFLYPDFQQFLPSEVTRQLQNYLPLITSNEGYKNIAFADDALLVDAEHHFDPIFSYIKELRTNLRFHTPNGLHCRYITKNVAKLMYDNKFSMVRLSYEASDASKRWQLASDGKITDATFNQAVENLKSAGYSPSHLEAYILVGLPGQTLDEVEKSAQAVHRLGVQVRLSQYSPIPGTPLFEASCQLYGVDPNEPLLHNNSILPAFAGSVSYEGYEAFKNNMEHINENIKSGRPNINGMDPAGV